MTEYLAHLDENKNKQLLKEHLEGTQRRAGAEGDKIGIGNIAQLIALFHDIGKYQESFQNYLWEAAEGRKGETVDHSSAGAGILGMLFGGCEGDERLALLKEIICYVISAHHGLYDIVSINEQDILQQRNEKMDASELRKLFLQWQTDLGRSEKEVQTFMKKACNDFQKSFLHLFSDVKKTRKTEYLFYAGCLVRLLLSVQIDADWSDTSIPMNSGAVPHDIDNGIIFAKAWDNYDHYMDELRQKADSGFTTDKEQKINIARTEIQKECLQFSEKECGIYCLPIPTGAGKTLTALGYALKYAKEHLGTEHEIEHIFYISPYISITEQNAQVIKEAVGNPKWVLEHHSNVINSDENDFEPVWEDAFICTTMVQFLNTLFSDRKKCIRRFHQLKNSIVIVDEVQSLPVKTLHTFNMMINFLNRMCRTNVILCTATQPALDSDYIKRKICYSKPQNMVSNLNMKYEQFDRVNIIPEFAEGMETMEGLAGKVAGAFHTVNSVLVIFNKKQTVSDFFDKMESILFDVDIYYLTTNLCAEHRSGRIGEIKEKLKQGKRILIISTNLIEAGVDLSVARVYRSLAGIDSIAQAAGRCNRSGELAMGQVVVFEMEEDAPGRDMEELLMAQKKTKEIQYRYGKSGEKQSILFPEWVKQYYDVFYNELQYKMDFTLEHEYRGNTIWGLLSTGFEGITQKHPLNQAFQTAGKMYQAIANTGFTVVVPYGDGNKLIEELEQGYGHEKIGNCLRKLQRYTVQVPYNREKELLEKGVIRESCGLPGVYIALGYDEIKGFKNAMQDAIFEGK